MKAHFCFILIFIWHTLLLAQSASPTPQGNISTVPSAGLRILVSPTHPIHIESGDATPVDLINASSLSTDVHNSCCYRISTYIENTTGADITIKLACVWRTQSFPFEWWSIDDKPNDPTAGDDNYGLFNRIPNTNGNDITIPANSIIPVEFYDPIVKLAVGRPLNVQVIDITESQGNYTYSPIPIQGSTTNEISGGTILPSSCSFILRECIVAYPNPTIEGGTILATAVVENAGTSPVTANLYLVLKQGTTEQIIHAVTGGSYDSGEQVILNMTNSVSLDPAFVQGTAELFVYYEAPVGSNREVVKEYLCSNPITVTIENPCASGNVPKPVAPGTANNVPLQKITTLTPTFLWKKICATGSGVTGYEIEVRDYLSGAIVSGFPITVNGINSNQYLAPTGLFRYSTQYEWTVTAISPLGNQTSIPFYFETPGPSNPNCQVTDIDQSIDTLLWDAVQYLCERGIVTPREWVQGGAQYDVNPTSEIVREHLAWITAAGLYGDRTTVESAYFYTTRYPIPFEDLAQAANNRDRYAKLLTYLDYDDQIVPFDGDRHNFQPADQIAIKFALKVFFEAFDIDTLYNPSTVPDITISNTDNMYRYVMRATELGLLEHYTNGLTTISANDDIKRGDAFIILYKIMTHPSLIRPTLADLDLDTNYVESNFYGAENYAVRPSLADGNFNSYSKTSFAIPGTSMPLVFSISYESSCLTFPEEIFPMNPVGKAWTHNHHGYIIETSGLGNWGGNDVVGTGSFNNSLAIFFPGSQHPHIFRRDGAGNLVAATKGLNYRITEDVANNRITIDMIDRTRFVFEKLPAGDHFDNVYMLQEVREKNGNRLSYAYTRYANNRSHLTQICAHYLNTVGAPVTPRCVDLIYYAGNQDLVERVEYPSPTGGAPRQVTFTYDFTTKNLNSYKDALPTMPCTGITLASELYFYDTSAETPHLLNKIQLPKGNYIENTYHDRKLKSTQLVNSVTGQILNQTTVQPQYNKFSAERDQTVTSIAAGGATTSMTQKRNAVGYITSTSYLRSDGGTDLFDIEYNNANFPQNPTKVTAYGVVTDITYNSFGAMETKDVNSSVLGVIYSEQWNYGTDSLLQSYTNRRGHSMYYSYDSRKNLVQMTDFEGEDTEYEYFLNGLRSKVRTPTQREYTFVYDDYGNLTSSTGPTGIITRNIYDNVGRLIQAVDAVGNITTMEYLANDLPTKVSRTNNGIVHEVEYCYDPNYNNIWIEDEKGQRTTMSYSFDEDYLTAIQFGSDTRTFSYTQKGLLDTETTPNGYVKNYDYNIHNELLEEDGYALYEYDAMNRDNLIRVRLLSNPTQEYIEYFYDDFDRVTSYTYHSSGPDYTVQYGYDEESNVTSITYPDYNGATGMRVDYTYNNNNQLETVSALGMVWQANRRADGSIDKIIYPNGMEKRYVYDGADRVNDLGYFTNNSTATPSNTLSRQQFTIDDRGFFTQEIVEGPNIPTLLPDLDLQFTHNSVNRIQTTTDALTGQTTNASFDADGNQLSGHYTGMVWNAFEQLEQIQNATGTFSATYNYGVLGQRNRAQRIRNGTTTTTNYFWEISGVGNMLREERTTNGTITALDYIHGFGEILARIPSGYTINSPPFSVIRDTVRFFVSDMRGTVIGLVDYNQDFTEHYEVTSYGEMISHEITAGEVPNYFIFVGAYGVEWEDTMLYKMGVRYYDVEQVNFLSEDPIWNTNLYAYAGGNTVMAIDPEGLEYKYNSGGVCIGGSLLASVRYCFTGYCDLSYCHFYHDIYRGGGTPNLEVYAPIGQANSLPETTDYWQPWQEASVGLRTPVKGLEMGVNLAIEDEELLIEPSSTINRRSLSLSNSNDSYEVNIGLSAPVPGTANYGEHKKTKAGSMRTPPKALADLIRELIWYETNGRIDVYD
ncbi:RHS repeat domain-containing protein [Aureispira anguillae]|uniref:RHS repeat-associated core domain-containing protein n=1 Tax=Aureispira anguillae TaxID=2864201 RepID=A0A916DY63_9BACT|nr:RHS repeat-associated core domain-containing protein [Aureispira anguillae]BDS15701.1 hypothetical protein AsAng_0064850 [Aureispira anguillae]